MATQVQNRRGTTAEHSTFTGANGELTVDTTKRTLVVHDGATAGGRPLLREDQSNLPTSAPTTGIYNASGSLAISTNGTGRFFINSAGRADVVSTSSVATNITSNQAITYLQLTNSTDAAGILSTGASLGFFAGSSGTERMRLTPTGLGIGSSAPSYLLDLLGSAPRIRVKDSSTGAAFHHFENNSGNFYLGIDNSTGGSLSAGNYARVLWSQGAYPLVFATNDTQRAQIDSSGRLLVGTSSAPTTVNGSKQFCVETSNAYTTAVLVTNQNNTNSAYLALQKSRGTNAGSMAAVQNGDELGGIQFIGTDGTTPWRGAEITAYVDGTPGANNMPGRLVFATTASGASSPTERMRIDSNGHVTIYKDASNLARLHLNGSSTRLEYSDSSGDLTFYTNSSGRVQVGYTGGFRPVTDNSQALGASGQRWTAVYAVNGTIQTSDLREKTDIATSSLGTDFIKQLRPVSYKFKVGGNIVTKDEDGETDIVTPRPGERTHWGFIAQEVKEVADAAGVNFGGWILTDKDDPASTQGLRYDQFIAPLTKALQEALEKIEILEAKIAALESA